MKFAGDPSAFLILGLNQLSIHVGKRFFGLLAIGYVHARTNVAGKGAVFMESWHANVEHPSVLAVVPSQTAFFPKRLPLVERPVVNLVASLFVLGMNNPGEASPEFSLRATREVQPKLVEISGLFVGSGHPDHHWCSIGKQTEALLALAYCFLSPAALGNVLHYACDAIDAGGTFNGKVGDEYVSFAEFRIRIFHLVSDDFTPKTSIQFLFHHGLKNPSVQHISDKMAYDSFSRHISIFQKLAICNHIAISSVNNGNHLFCAFHGIFVFT